MTVSLPCFASLLYLVLRRVLALVAPDHGSDQAAQIEILVLRHQLGVLRRQVKRPVYRRRDRALLAVASRILPKENWGAFLVRPHPASFSGKWGLNTRLVHLSGDHTVTFSHAGSGNFIVQLLPPGGSIFDGESIANEIGRVKDSTQVYGLDGDYYFDVIADGAWTISIKAQT